MKRNTAFVCTIFLLAGFAFAAQKSSAQRPLASVPSSPLATREQQIAQAAEALRQQLINQRRDFHMHPELSNREERTAKVIAERLRALGFDEVKTNVARHGIVALLKGKKPGPVVAVRTDLDALP